MQSFLRLALALALCACLLLPQSFLAEEAGLTDYAGQLTLDLFSDTLKVEARVKTFVDGDTTHFYVSGYGVMKVRYLACNTPESTGKIEPWGKAASEFTRERLENAEAILIESDNGRWNMDTGGDRVLAWVWYIPSGGTAYRNLNLELLQNGLAVANSSAQNRYGESCMAAIAQARALKLHVYSDEKDPDFFYGDAIELTIRELRLHPEAYDGKKVAFTGIVTMNHNNAVFIEDFDEETGLYFGISAYYGFNLSVGGLDVLHVGNEARIVGVMQYYEAGETWQVSGLNYRMMKPNDPGNIQKISSGNSPSWKEIDADSFWRTVEIDTGGKREAFAFPYLALDTSVTLIGTAEIKNSPVQGLICLEVSGGADSVTVYAESLTNENGRALTQEDLNGHALCVRGIVICLNGAYCIRVFTRDGITILN